MIRDFSRNPWSRTWFGPHTQEPEGDITMVNPAAIIGSVNTKEFSLCKFRVGTTNLGGCTYYFHILNTLGGPAREEVKRECVQAAAMAFSCMKSQVGKAFGWRGPRRQAKLHPLLWDLCGGTMVPSRLVAEP